MNWNNDILEELEALAALPGLTNEEISIILGIESSLFTNEIKKHNSQLSIAYHKGKLLSKSQLAKKIKTLSDQGSGPAQTLQEKLYRQTTIQNLYNEYAQSEREA